MTSDIAGHIDDQRSFIMRVKIKVVVQYGKG